MTAKMFDPEAVLRAGRNHRVQALIGVVFVLYLLYHLTQFRVSQVWPIQPLGDLLILFDTARGIFAHVRYPDGVFPYPPSAVVLMRALSVGGPALFALAWYLATIAGLVITVRAALAQERDELRAAWPLIGVIAVSLTDAAISWDLRNYNNNLIYLGLVMAAYSGARERPWLAGALAGLSGSFKLYSGLLMVWLFVHRPYRMFRVMVVTGVALWLVVPLMLFGLDGTATLYSGWAQQVDRIADPTFHAQLMVQQPAVPIVSLRRAFVNVTGEPFQSPTVDTLLWLTHGLWMTVLAWYAWRCRHHVVATLPSRAALADWTVLLIAPLPLSPWLEPYHAIPLLAAAVLLTAIALDAHAEDRDRRAALTTMAALALFLAITVPFPIRGLGLLGQFIVVVAGLGVARPRLALRHCRMPPGFSAPPVHASP